MLTAYFKIYQQGIEPLKKYKPLSKRKPTVMDFYDFRITVQYYFNEKKSSGVGILTFAPI